MSFVKEFTRALILAQAKGKRIGEARKVIGFQERIPMLRRIPPSPAKMALPPPRAPSAQQQAAQERSLPKFLPIPTSTGLRMPASETIIGQVQIRPPEPARNEMQEEKNHDVSKYIKINIPSPEGIDVPVPETDEKATGMDELTFSHETLTPPHPGAVEPRMEREGGARREMERQESQFPRTPFPKPSPSFSPSPSSAKNFGIDFGSISDFVADPYIKSIEFSDGKIKVRTDREEKDQGLLGEDEARQIVERFAKAADVAVQPAFEATVPGLKLEAVISEVLGIRFVIEKV